MLRKGDNAQHTITANRRHKPAHDSVHHFTENNKENLNSKSLFEHPNDPDTSHNKTGQQSNYGSTMVSPTFQSNNLVSLKDDLFRQNRGYVEVSLNLKDIHKKSAENGPVKTQNGGRKTEEAYSMERQIEDEKKRLMQHYKNKRYWSKIEKLFEQEGVDGVLAWEDSITRYKTIKQKLQSNEHQNGSLRQQLGFKVQANRALEQQITDQKNETRVVTQRKSKDIEKLQQKQKQYFELYEQHKQQSKQLKQRDEQIASFKKQLAKMEEKYLDEKSLKEEMQKKRALLKQQVQRRNSKLVEKDRMQKELSSQIVKIKSEERSNSKQLHIECQQLKQFKYQTEKNMAKVDQKHKKELVEITEKYRQTLQQKLIYEEKMNKIRLQLNDLRPKLLQHELQLDSATTSLTIKNNEYEAIKKKHIELMTEQRSKNNDLQALLKVKDDEISKAYQLIDEGENLKTKMQVEMNHERKQSEDKDEEISKHAEMLRELENKLKENDFQDNRGQNLYKTKNLASNASNSPSINHNQAGTNYSRKMNVKIREVYCQIKKLNQESLDSLQRRRYREDDSDERESLSPYQVEKYVNEIHTDISNVINKYIFVHNENNILKEKLDNDQEENGSELKRIRNELTLKEQTLRSILAFVPEDMKDGVVDLLQITETLSGSEFHEESEFDDYNDLRESLENEGKEWRGNYQAMRFKFRKMEDDIRRLQEDNEGMRRKTKGKEVKKTLATDYDYREAVSKKDIRKKYNFDH